MVRTSIVVCAGLLLLAGCDQPAEDRGDQAQTSRLQQETVPSYSSLGTRYYIADLQEDGSRVFGDYVGILPAYEAVDLLIYGEYETHEGDSRPLLPAMMGDEAVWVSAFYIAPGTVLGATTAADPATVYTGLGITDNTRNRLSRGQIITVFPQTEEQAERGRKRFYGYQLELSSGGTENFGNFSRGSEWFLPETAVTTSQDDVELLRYLAVNDQRPADLQLEPLEMLREEYATSVFIDMVDERIENLLDAQENPLATESYTATGRIVGSNVRVREQPNRHLENIVGLLEVGTQVTVTQRTVETVEIEDTRNYWYYVEADEASGWMYGHFLEQD